MTALIVAVLIACGPMLVPLIDGEQAPAGEEAAASPPAAPPAAPATPDPTRAPGAVIVTGRASWYGTGPGAGHAAAGPALRSALGKHWRGTHLTIWYGKAHVDVVIDDWCQCSYRKPGEKTIDLSDEDFGTLTDFGKGPQLQRGVIRVVVTR
jgi:hypothetical protein